VGVDGLGVGFAPVVVGLPDEFLDLHHGGDGLVGQADDVGGRGVDDVDHFADGVGVAQGVGGVGVGVVRCPGVMHRDGR
jgi:hypothetical protein